MSAVNLRCGCAGRFVAIKAVRMDDAGNVISERHLAGPFNNLITDQGLERMGANGNYLQYCQVGSGNTPPVDADTTLETYVAGVAANTSASVSSAGAQPTPPYYGWVRIFYQFSPGVATGNLSEIGIGWAASGSTLYSRALILDSGGTPTTITVLADEYLQVTYEWRIYPPLSDVTGTINISGVPYNYTVRASVVTTTQGQFNMGWGPGAVGGFVIPGYPPTAVAPSATYIFTDGNIGSITAGPGGTSAGGSVSVSTSAYSGGSLQRDISLTWGIGTTGNIRSVKYAFLIGACFQVEYDPIIPKTSSNTLTLSYRISWDRAIIP